MIAPGTITPPNRYWRMDTFFGSGATHYEVVDSYAGDSMSSYLAGALSGVGGVPGGPGLIGNCCKSIDNNGSGIENYWQGHPLINYSAVNGFSMSCWVKLETWQTGIGTPVFNNWHAYFAVQFINPAPPILLKTFVHSNYAGGYEPYTMGFNESFYTVSASLSVSGSVVGTTPDSVTFPVDHFATGTTNWHQIITAYSQPLNLLSVYLDGVLIGSVTPSVAPSATAFGGVYVTTANGPQSPCISVLFDECGFWSNHCLSASEAVLLYNGGAGSRPAGA